MGNFRHNGYLIHYNHNHDALGRFTSGPGGVGRSVIKAVRKDKRQAVKNHLKYEREYRKAFNKVDPVKGGVVDSPDLEATMARKRNTTNRDKVTDRLRKNLYWDSNHEVAKAWDKYEKHEVKYINYLDTSEKISQKQVDRFEKRGDQLLKEYNQIKREAVKDYARPYAKATIKDLNLKNTKEVEDFIVDHLDDDWESASYGTTKLKR